MSEDLTGLMRWSHDFISEMMFYFFQILVFNRKMLEDSMPASAASTAVITTTAQHQQMAREIQNADFAEEYFASLSAPAKRLIEVRKIIIILHTFHFWYSKTNCFLRFIKSLQCLKITSKVSFFKIVSEAFFAILNFRA